MAENESTVREFDSEDTIAARVAIREMVIDETYQGRVSRPLIAKIAREWRDDSAGVVILNLRDDNTYAVLDGQHRVTAATAVGVRDLNALVYIGKTREEEAALFVALNTKHNVRPLDRFRANLRSGAQRERQIDKALRDAGLRIEDNHGNPDCVRCVAALLRIVADHGIDWLRSVAFVLTSAFSTYPDRAKGYSVGAWRGVAQLLYRFPNTDIPRLIERMREKGPVVVHGMAGAETRGGAETWMGWGRALTRLYNTGTRTHFKDHLPMDRWEQKLFTPAGREATKAQRKVNAVSGAASALARKA